jgi:hypothetical protein
MWERLCDAQFIKSPLRNWGSYNSKPQFPTATVKCNPIWIVCCAAMASSAFQCQTIIIIYWKISCPKWDIPKNSKKFSIFLHKFYFFLDFIF